MSSKVLAGMYRGTVVSVDDPENRYRVLVYVPSVTGEYAAGWAEPCFQYCADTEGDCFLPVVGDTLWIMFEEGKLNRPVWIGNWYSTAKAPQDIATSKTKRVIMYQGTKIVIGGGVVEVVGNLAVQGNITATGSISATGTVTGSNIR